MSIHVARARTGARTTRSISVRRTQLLGTHELISTINHTRRTAEAVLDVMRTLCEEAERIFGEARPSTKLGEPTIYF